MASIEYLVVGAPDEAAGSTFYADALGLGDRVRVQPSAAASAGFRGFLLGLVVAYPAEADALLASAIAAGGTTLQPAKKSLWGYGGSVQAPDGTMVTVASSSKKNSGPAPSDISSIPLEGLVLQLGVEDVSASKDFYAARGFTVGKSFGRKYAELETGSITLALNRRGDLAKNVGVSPDGSGSHRLIVVGDAGEFVDLDGYEWITA